MAPDVFLRRRHLPTDRCACCGRLVDRVWLVPGDVEESCARCYAQVTGRAPVHEQGHSSPPAIRPASAPPAFYVRLDGRRAG